MSKVKGLRPTIRPWRRVRTELVAQYPVFGVERHAIVDGDGNPKKDVSTLRLADWCNVLAITPEQKLVMVWQYRFGTGEMSLEIPGGIVDPGEEPLFAAGRELAEEAGYVPGPSGLVHLATMDTNPAMQGNRCHSFVAEGATPTGNQSFDDLEELEVCLVDLDDLPALVDEGVVRHGLIVASLERFLRKRGLGRFVR